MPGRYWLHEGLVSPFAFACPFRLLRRGDGIGAAVLRCADGKRRQRRFCHAGGDGVIEGALIERNVVYDNEHKGFSIISAPGARIQNNVTWGNGIGGAAGGIHLVDEPGCGQPTNDAVVVNNTLIEPNIAGIRMTDGATGNVIFNNLIVSGNPIADEVGSSHIDAASNMTRSSTVGLFLDAASHDYRLASGSDAIDAGTSSYQSEPAAPTDFDNVPRPLGSGHDVGAFEAAAPVAVRQPSHASALALHAPAPNPFSAATTIRYELPVRRHVTVQLFDAMGRMVETLEDSEQAPGEHEVHLDGGELADGIYFVRVRAGDEITTRTLVRI